MLSEELEQEWPVWRLVLSDPQVATLTELDSHWSYIDILKANSLLDMRQDQESYQRSLE